MIRLENIERQEEKGNGGVEIKLNRHAMIECRLLKGIGDNFRVIAIVVCLCQHIQRQSYRNHSKESAIITADCISS